LKEGGRLADTNGNRHNKYTIRNQKLLPSEEDVRMDITQSEIHASNVKLTFLQRHAYWWMYVGLLLSDVIGLSISLVLGLLIRQTILGPVASLRVYPNILPLLLIVTILIYAFQGLYITGGTNTVDELSLLSKGSSLSFLLLSAFTFLTQTSLQYSRFIFSTTWLLSLVLVPTFRLILRKTSSSIGIWGKPIIIIGNGDTTHTLVDYFSKNKAIGWQPVAILGTQNKISDSENVRIPFYSAQSTSQLVNLIDLFKTDTVIIVQREVPEPWIDRMIQPSYQHVRKIIIVSGHEGINNIHIKAHDIAGTLGLEIKQNLLGPWGRTTKRFLDIFLVLLGGIIAFPFLAIIALLIRLDSKGKVFYAQDRIGYQGKPIRVWKFRTMVEEADEVLEKYLRQNPNLRLEWEANHKLKDDPRITRVGSILRKLSLDELPQIWNILRGEMSLVGPRPIVDEEIVRYGDSFDLYTYVVPGMTGLWQVSGRNNTTYERRVQLDGYYVQNWSIWLDIYILIKTIWVVISREGAY